MILAGTPETIALAGIFSIITEFGHIITLSPMVIFPIALLPTVKDTLFPIVALFFCEPLLPITTPDVTVQ